MVAVAACVTAAGVRARCQERLPIPESITAICIEHIGEEDKPITSIVIGTAATAEAECRPGFYHYRVDTFQVSKEQLAALAGQIRPNRVPQPDGKFGTFEWRILGGDHTTKFLTGPDESVRLLSDLIDAAKDTRVRNALKHTLLRLGITDR